MSLHQLSIELRQNHINEKIEDLLFHMEDIKEKKDFLSKYTEDSENIYQQLYKNLISFYEEYTEQLKQLEDDNLIDNIGIVQMIVLQRINEKKMKKELKEYLKYFNKLYDEFIDINNLQ